MLYITLKKIKKEVCLMKYRIKKVKYYNGKVRYFPQYKRIFWFNFKSVCSNIIKFSSLEKAEKYIEKQNEDYINNKVKIMHDDIWGSTIIKRYYK